MSAFDPKRTWVPSRLSCRQLSADNSFFLTTNSGPQQLVTSAAVPGLGTSSTFSWISVESRVFVTEFLCGFEIRGIVGLHCRIEVIENVDNDTRPRRWPLDCDDFAAEHERAVARRLSKRFAGQRTEIFCEALRVSDVDLAYDIRWWFALRMKRLDQAGA